MCSAVQAHALPYREASDHPDRRNPLNTPENDMASNNQGQQGQQGQNQQGQNQRRQQGDKGNPFGQPEQSTPGGSDQQGRRDLNPAQQGGSRSGRPGQDESDSRPGDNNAM
jgi:hypothetical protein